MLNAWSLRDCLKSKSVTIHLSKNFCIKGLATGLDADGSLLVRRDDKVLKVTVGEVVHVK